VSTNISDWVNSPPTKDSIFFFMEREWQYLEKLGEGGFGVSHHVRSAEIGDVVFKVFKYPNDDTVRDATKEFQRMWSGRTSLSGCAKVHFLIQEDGHTVGIAYEYVEGRTLEELVAVGGAELPWAEFSPDAIQRICLSLLDTLASLHQGAKLIHRDIKPANIVITQDHQQPFLIDFGLATPINSRTRMGAGTPKYMPPESAYTEANYKFDLYGFSASMVEWIVGRRLFEKSFTGNGNSGGPALYRPLAEGDIDELDSLSRGLVRQLEKGLAAIPADRPRDAEVFKDLLSQVESIDDMAGEERINHNVTLLLGIRRGSAGVLATEDDFALKTRVTTKLDFELFGKISGGDLDIAFLTGNPGDGKTTFLNELRDRLAHGGELIRHDSKSWVLEREGRQFEAMLDASESDGDVPSDQRLAELLRRAESGEVVALVAINDGRLDGFLRSFSDEFEFAGEFRRQLRGAEATDSRRIVVDLKRRALVALPSSGEEGIGRQMMVSLTAPDLWTDCRDCGSRTVCPILENSLRLSSEPVLDGLDRLLSISHFRRDQRATFRDVRSVFAYLITGDLSCQDVHSARKEGRNLRKAVGTLYFDLAFGGRADEHLLSSWSQADPALLPLADIARRVSANATGSHSPFWIRSVGSYAREAFFGVGQGITEEADSREVMVYRHLEDFVTLLERPDEDLKNRVLLGLSRLLGAFHYSRKNLAVAASDRSQSWTVLREIDSSLIEIVAPTQTQVFVEECGDSVELRYRNQLSLRLALDDVEIILRAEQGEVFNDVHSSAVVGKLDGFASGVRLLETNKVTILSPQGGRFQAEASGPVVELSKT
jgi:serine/threonine protein kinase